MVDFSVGTGPSVPPNPPSSPPPPPPGGPVPPPPPHEEVMAMLRQIKEALERIERKLV